MQWCIDLLTAHPLIVPFPHSPHLLAIVHVSAADDKEKVRQSKGAHARFMA
ncbi:hypothetical protein TPADAL_0361a [Treponema pallidum subsp. pallidum DAL-1]|uniref:Uncharacterized protein n=2 Tax=Treponema pallidum TaxID=160 RepID=A0AAU8RND9_TREPL|nr:hypothetical protein TPESAMD_0361a [Treponema pallidum subsp. pertenue str. SamoaD]AEZ58551.1 hypothetical protein TPECDC2_0361a [Treponema pallidum subsp. pertenue str. CDC2]AEZ59619.1 hypothetical protein TPEGAU_0361a [Treponema pallidum subsp. pertenue str. Gauthier]AEZ60683.1 hypothetical protein TPADAL_0361a [Treponema pallidum subsp. pallidum DAL-1]AGK84006.1 hypothetical protein TPFB_0361a [Treponema pallidum str. Fribourg-Blanc]AJB40380.1 hypothetical protein TENDBA_0361a [Treponema